MTGVSGLSVAPMYPVRAGVPLDPIVAGFGPLKIDPTPLATIAAKREEASLLVDRLGYDR